MHKTEQYYGRIEELDHENHFYGSLGLANDNYTWHTVTSNPAELNNLHSGKLHTALSVFEIFGYSKQDGTPSFPDPVEIVSAGSSGSLTVTVSNGSGNSSQFLLSTSGGLLGIPVEGEGNIIIDGQEYVSDYIDAENGVYVKRIGRKNLSDEIIDKMNGLTFRRTTGGYELGNDGNSFFPFADQAMCDKFAIAHNDAIYKNSSGFLLSKQWVSLPAGYTSKGDYTMFFLDNRIYVNYVLDTPIETAIPDSSLAGYRALAAYTPKTIIQVSDGVGLNITYKVIAK